MSLYSTQMLDYVKQDWPHNNHAHACDEFTHRGKTFVILSGAAVVSLAEALHLGCRLIYRQSTGRIGFGEGYHRGIGYDQNDFNRAISENFVNSLVGQVQNVFLQRVLP
jgi:hypothetical protein